jgi:hypothetical protein
MYGECVIKELSEHSKNTNMVITAKIKESRNIVKIWLGI